MLGIKRQRNSASVVNARKAGDPLEAENKVLTPGQSGKDIERGQSRCAMAMGYPRKIR